MEGRKLKKAVAIISKSVAKILNVYMGTIPS
jgi:hypothetical protein